MTVEVKPEDMTLPAEARKRLAKRRRELIRRFADQFANAPVEITPRWQKAIDNYRRNKGIEVAEVEEVGQPDE